MDELPERKRGRPSLLGDYLDTVSEGRVTPGHSTLGCSDPEVTPI